MQVPAGQEAALHHPALDRRGAGAAAGAQWQGAGQTHGGQILSQGGVFRFASDYMCTLQDKFRAIWPCIRNKSFCTLN